MTDADAISLAEGVSLITPDRLQTICNAVRETAHLSGSMAELGAHRGGSAKVICAGCPEKILHLFDTFTGLPYTEVPELDPDGHCPEGRFACDEREVREYLHGCNVAFHVGLFPQTAKGLYEWFSFVHVDCDLKQSAEDAIDWFWPRMVNDGIMLFDDYNCKFTGVTEAVQTVFYPNQIEEFEYGDIKIGCQVRK